jgi:hypothetical protein
MTALTLHRPSSPHRPYRPWVTEVPPEPGKPPPPSPRLAGEDDEDSFEPHIFRGID